MRIENQGEITRGVARGIDTHGALLVETPAACGASFPAKSRCEPINDDLVSRHRQYPGEVGTAARRGLVACTRGYTRAAPRALRALVRSASREVTRVVAVSVAGAKLDRALSGAVRSRLGLPVEFVRSARTAAGVRNGYRDTWRLGADRWVGVIAAHAIAGSRPALIANIGTALTIDAVTRDGHHLGGVITPGPSTMIASLLDGTHGIRRRARRPRGAGAPSRRLRARYRERTGRGSPCGGLTDRPRHARGCGHVARKANAAADWRSRGAIAALHQEPVSRGAGSRAARAWGAGARP